MVCCQTVPEGGRCLLAGAECLQKICELVNECVFVSDLQTRDPPAFHIRMIAVGHMDASPASDLPFVPMIEELDSMQIVQVPGGGSTLAIDFERIQRLVAAGIACGFKSRQGSILEPAEKRTGVIDANLLHTPGQVVLSLLDECLRHRGHFSDRTIQPQGRIDRM